MRAIHDCVLFAGRRMMISVDESNKTSQHLSRGRIRNSLHQQKTSSNGSNQYGMMQIKTLNSSNELSQLA